MAAIKKYRQHYCTANHRSFPTMAKCVWKRAAWIAGDGEYAVLARCRALTVTLHPNADEAERSKALIDDTACGGMCHGAHEIVQLVLP